MKIQSITITAQATKNYQSYTFAATAEEVSKEDVFNLKSWAIAEAKDGINKLTGEAKVEPKVEVKANIKPQLGEVRDFAVEATGEKVAYKYMYSKTKNEYFWLIQDESALGRGAKKYIAVK